MVKEKQSFFSKISNADAGSLKAEDEDNNFTSPQTGDNQKDNQDQEGQLAVDVYETPATVVVESIIGGVTTDNINVAVANDVLTIKGIREKNSDTSEAVNYFVSECFWGPFSRSIILPCQVDIDDIKASIKKGILRITLPKLSGSKTKKIKIEEN